MSNSSLISYTKISPNKSSPRNHRIDTITIHCTAGQCSVEGLGKLFSDKKVGASSNYGIGADGRIGLYVDENDRSWCSSNAPNDNRAITIEVSSDSTHPYKVNSNAYNSLINLLVDVCKRNGIKKLLWQSNKMLIGYTDKQNMTVHRWFSNKACPGDFLYKKHFEIAELVNKRLEEQSQTENKNVSTYRVKVTATALNIRSEASADSPVRGQIRDKGVYTIVETCGNWGRLKSGAGWICLSYTRKI